MAKKSAYTYALSLLLRKDYSQYKLLEKLSTKEYSDEEIIDTIELLKEDGYINDIKFADNLVRSLVNRGKSKSYILRRVEVERVKVDKDQILEFISNYSDNSIDAVTRIIQRKIRQLGSKNLTSYDLAQRVCQTLYMRGFTERKYRDLVFSQIKGQNLEENVQEC